MHQIFAADKIANVIAVREAYEVWGEDVEEEMERELDEQILLWEDDLEMLFYIEEDVQLFDRLAEELLALWQLRVSSDSGP